ncbi:MAG: cytochrome b/b6 domain-containing protein [candidate division WOR-3 bacterium]
MKGKRNILRFSLNWRIQHFLLMVSVSLLIISGIALRFSDSWFGKFLIFLEGGFEARGALHRLSAFLLIFTALYHLIYIIFTKEGRKEFKSFLFEKDDFSNYFKTILYNFGKINEKPKIKRYGFKEKLQYWVFFLFVFLMIITGIVMWWHNYFLVLIPKWLFDLVYGIHGWGGTLILIFIVFWHIYEIHLTPSNFPINLSFWDGYVSEEWLKEEHFLEYEEMKKGEE